MSRKIYSILFLLTISMNACANGINMHLSGGLGWADFHNTDSIYLNDFVENSYALSQSARSAPFASAGIGYQWKNPFAALPYLNLNLGASGYYSSYQLSGINSPFVNAGQFDTLNFYAKDTSYALLLEPKIIATYSTQWQPYVLAGVGIAWNQATGYSESPTNPDLSAVPMPIPFANKTVTNIAYEIGFGVQMLLLKTYSLNTLNLFGEYKYIHFGDMQLNTTPLQTTTRGPNLGNLQSQFIGIGLEYQFA